MRPQAWDYLEPDADATGFSKRARIKCGSTDVPAETAPCMSGEYQCAQLSTVLQPIINKAYAAGKQDAMRAKAAR